MLTRRGFVGRLAGAFAVALASPTLLELLPAPAAPALAFDPAAFGISMRFIRNFDHAADALRYSRMDVLYGFASIQPQGMMCRFSELPDPTAWEPRGSFAAYLEADREVQARTAAVPCAYCIRMVGDHCRKRGCLRDSYYRGALDLPAGFDWDPS